MVKGNSYELRIFSVIFQRVELYLNFIQNYITHVLVFYISATQSSSTNASAGMLSHQLPGCGKCPVSYYYNIYNM